MLNKSMGFMAKVISVLVAVVMIVLGLIFFFKFDPKAYDKKGTGIIVEIDEHYELVGGDNELMHTVYIDYDAERQAYKHAEFPEYNSGMEVGDTVEFYYMSEDPSQIVGSDKDAAPYIGLAFAVVGLIMLLVQAFQFLRGRHL